MTLSAQQVLAPRLRRHSDREDQTNRANREQLYSGRRKETGGLPLARRPAGRVHHGGGGDPGYGSRALAGTVSTGMVSTAIAEAATMTTAAGTVPGSDCSASSRGLALSRAGWSASSNAHPSSTDAPANALDGNSSTRFSTDVPQAPGLFFEVDLGSKQSFDELAMESPSSPNDYARGYYIEVSDDASSWTIVANCTGTSSPEVVRLAAQTAR